MPVTGGSNPVKSGNNGFGNSGDNAIGGGQYELLPNKKPKSPPVEQTEAQKSRSEQAETDQELPQ